MKIETWGCAEILSLIHLGANCAHSHVIRNSRSPLDYNIEISSSLSPPWCRKISVLIGEILHRCCTSAKTRLNKCTWTILCRMQEATWTSVRDRIARHKRIKGIERKNTGRAQERLIAKVPRAIESRRSRRFRVTLSKTRRYRAREEKTNYSSYRAGKFVQLCSGLS